LASIFSRFRARRRLKAEVGLWYHPEYVAPLLSRTYRVFGVEPRRGELCLGALAREGLLRDGDVRSVSLATPCDLCRFHSADYLESTTDPEVLGHIFGLEPHRVQVDDLLLMQRRHVGGTIAAASEAAWGRRSIAFNLGGGFHHAGPEQGSGFCVYNDVGVAIAKLREEGYRDPIAIIDLDFHQGDGNSVAFAHDPTVLTYSIHGSVWTHVDAVADVSLLLPSGSGDTAYLGLLDETLPGALAAHRPGLVFYLAGTDVLAGDPLGDFRLSLQGVLDRDRRVVELVRKTGASLIITLAGGYSLGAWRSTRYFLRWILTGQATVRPRPERDLQQHYARIARRLDPAALRKENESSQWALDEREILEGLGPPESRGGLFLDYYTRPGLEYALERYGFLGEIRDRGFTDLEVSVDTRDRSHQVLRIHGTRLGEATGKRYLLVEVVVRRRSLPAPQGVTPNHDLELLSVEWLLLQNPTLDFTVGRPRLPGQEHPGLGLAHEAQEMLVRVCHRLKLDGLIHCPAHYHMARVGVPRFCFFDPEKQGRFLAIQEVLSGHDLVMATVAVDAGALRKGDGSVLAWDPAEFVLPVSDRLRSYFDSTAYREACEAARRRLLDEGPHLDLGPRREAGNSA
jgi:acetoin utilization deacetylase AcuC-like enzyme